MKQFETDLQAKAHLKKIQNAKPTLLHKKSHMSDSKTLDRNEVQLIIHLYDIGEFQSIPVYKLLKSAGLQQYSRQLISRGYGVNISRLALLNDKDKQKLFEDIKILPGHTVKFDKIILSVAQLTQHNQSTFTQTSISSGASSKKDIEQEDYENQLGKVFSQYAVKENKPSQRILKKESVQTRSSDKKDFRKDKPKLTMNSSSKIHPEGKSDTFHRLNTQKKITQVPSKDSLTRTNGRQKRSIDLSRTTIKHMPPRCKKSLPPSLHSISAQKRSKQIVDTNLQIDKIKCLYMSVDGGIMTSTIVNVDLEQICFCIASYIQKIIVKPQKKPTNVNNESLNESSELNKDDLDNILRESYLHPLYTRQISTNIDDSVNIDDTEEVQEEIQPAQDSQNQKTGGDVDEQFLLGNSSVSFGLETAIQIFQEPNPTQVDYYIPTVDSLTNFIKNIIISAKMQREVPVLSLLYVVKFLTKSKVSLTSLNYKRIVVTCLLLASKVWDDQSFQTPSFSHTFPDYSTVLLNQLQKQILICLNYQLKLNKREYALLYYQIRQHRKPNVKSFQNRLLSIKRVMDLQKGVVKVYRADNFKKRKSF